MRATKERERMALRAKSLFDAGRIADASVALREADEWNQTLRMIEAGCRPKQL
jgi:hypothetical protein